MKARLIAAGLIFAILSAPRPCQAKAAPTEEEIRQAIERGVAFLKGTQDQEGGWDYQNNAEHRLGMTALAGLALMENGVARDDPVIRRAQKVVHEIAPTSNQTYDLALAILFLARAQPGSKGENDDLIRILGRRLSEGHHGGKWTYNVPVEVDSKPAPGSRNRRRPPRTRGGPGDNSNTQFALLGVWAASRHGLDGNEPLAAIDEHFRETQTERGGWGYQDDGNGSPAMSCAGLMGLAIAAARPEKAERQSARARGAALAVDPAFMQALKVVSNDARKIGPSSDIYYIWSLERVCVALGLKTLDGFDWYAEGASELIGRQQRNGSWPEPRWGSMPQTCLALLFLRKANLAFELDRVLKLPDPNRPQVASNDPEPKPDPAPTAPKTGGEDVAVTVQQADESRFPEISIDFQVKRGDGSPLLDATQDDFHVKEYDQPVKITRFQSPNSKEIRPTTVVLVVDRSQSMEEEDRIGGLKKAVAAFLASMPKGSRVAVIAFGSDVNLLCPFTSDVTLIQNAVDTLTPSGATRYYDAVAEAIGMLSKESGRRAVLALTDGEDTFSQNADLAKVVLAARTAGLPVHTLGLGTEDEIESDALKALARDTRGQYFSARQADQLRAIYEELAKGLGQSYSLSYVSERKLPDGTLRPIQVVYRQSKKVGVAAVYIAGMVVPARGWSLLFLALIAGLVALAALPSALRRRAAGGAL